MNPTAYTIYELAGGAILRSGYRADFEDLLDHLDEGQALYAGEALEDHRWKIINGEKVSLTPTVDMVALEKELLLQIDMNAEAVRGLFITNTASQPTVYLEKFDEAELFMANAEISEQLTPNLVKDAARYGIDRFTAAMVIISKRYEWKSISAEIEDIRLSAKDAVRAATDAESKRLAAAIDWSAVAQLAT